LFLANFVHAEVFQPYFLADCFAHKITYLMALTNNNNNNNINNNNNNNNNNNIGLLCDPDRYTQIPTLQRPIFLN